MKNKDNTRQQQQT